MKQAGNKTKKKIMRLSSLLKFIIVIVSGIGLYLNFKIIPIDKALLYFTIQSNLMCFIFYLITTILKLCNKLKKNDFYYICKGMVTMAITLTMVVYWGILSSDVGMEIYFGHEIACRFVHLYTPLLIIVDYIIFGEKGNLKKIYPVIWSTILIIYMLFILIYILLGGTFMYGAMQPYFYMDVEVYGVFGVFINSIFVYVCYLFYGILIQKLDNIIASRKRENKADGK